MAFLPTVVRAEYCGETRIHLVFNDGVENAVDLEPWLDGPMSEPLRDPGYFRRFFPEGGSVTWPNGADIAPETLYERAKSSAAAQPGNGPDPLELACLPRGILRRQLSARRSAVHWRSIDCES
jgi:hypothetical protein